MASDGNRNKEILLYKNNESGSNQNVINLIFYVMHTCRITYAQSSLSMMHVNKKKKKLHHSKS
jgi:hypothetical protein